MISGSLFALALIAQVTADQLPSPTHWMTMGWVVAAIFGIVGLANQGVDLWRKMFPSEQPPAHMKYATKDELAAHKAQQQREIQEVKQLLNDEIGRVDEKFDEAFKRIESRFEEWLTQMDTKISGEHRDLHQWQRDVEHKLGQIEAKADQALKPRR